MIKSKFSDKIVHNNVKPVFEHDTKHKAKTRKRLAEAKTKARRQIRASDKRELTNVMKGI